MYEIQSKNDFQTGAAVVVKVLEDELDQKALYTIQAERPDFILPFHHRAIDGQIEFTYQIGNCSKLTYLSGERSPSEYNDLWQSILQPILDCGDWFMTPYSLVFESDHLYYDKTGRTISYIYIPSKRPCSDYNALKRMVMEVAKLNHVTDINLENKAIWAIQDFNPKEFLKIVKSVGTQEAQRMASGEQADFMRQPVQPMQQPVQMTAQQMRDNNLYAQQPGQYEYQFAQSARQPALSGQQPAPSVQQPAPSVQPGFCGNARQAPQARTSPASQIQAPRANIQPASQVHMQQTISSASQVPAPQANRPPESQLHTSAQANIAPRTDDDAAVLDVVYKNNGPRFRYTGHGEHPRVIMVDIVTDGGVFTIGRFDASVGSRQSNFEFDKKVKAVSRRHALVERKAEVYCIVDLSSSAGTFVNGRKLPPNTSIVLQNGCRVSFGNAGAEYIWEE